MRRVCRRAPAVFFSTRLLACVRARACASVTVKARPVGCTRPCFFCRPTTSSQSRGDLLVSKNKKIQTNSFRVLQGLWANRDDESHLRSAGRRRAFCQRLRKVSAASPLPLSLSSANPTSKTRLTDEPADRPGVK